MQYPFLHEFPKRMKVVGMYALLLRNSSQKQCWRDCGFEEEDEQINLLFSVLLFVMEQSLREVVCTIDDITEFVEDVNLRYFHKEMDYDACHRLAEFVIGKILSNDGLQMKFSGYDFEKEEYEKIHISFIANRVAYEGSEKRKTTYYITDMGYSLLLGTLEVENNMRLTIQEMIFNEHLKKQNFDKALLDIKNIFEMMRMEKLKNNEAVARIRQNVLNFSVDDYSQRIDETFATIRETRTRMERHKEMVMSKLQSLESSHIDIDNIAKEDADLIVKLSEISAYIDKTINSHMEVLQSYNNYREVCMKEMENYLQISQVERFSFAHELFDKILEDCRLLEHVDRFLHPLFLRAPSKIFNLNKIFVPQKKREERSVGVEIERVDFDEQAWKDEQKRIKEEKVARFKTCLMVLLERASVSGRVTLEQISAEAKNDADLLQRFIPNVSIFKEVMVELLRTRNFDLARIREALNASLVQKDEGTVGVQIGELLVTLAQEKEELRGLVRVTVRKVEPETNVRFEHVCAQGKSFTNIVCNNLIFEIAF